jgi:hypothetical protein
VRCGAGRGDTAAVEREARADAAAAAADGFHARTAAPMRERAGSMRAIPARSGDFRVADGGGLRKAIAFAPYMEGDRRDTAADALTATGLASGV